DRFAIPEEEDLDLDLDLELALPAATTASATDGAFRDSMLELEQTLQDETRDISARFQDERRPAPAGLDRALSDAYRPQRPSGDNFAQQRYASKSGGFVTGFDPLSKEEQAKKANRAQRFGALPQAETSNKDKPADQQDSSMDLDDGEWVRPDNLPLTPPMTSTIRPEAVYLYGTDEMSTKDILKYFEAYGPSHVEWIDDSSCNVVFPDQFSAKRALYFQLVDQNTNFGEDDAVEPGRTESAADGTDMSSTSTPVVMLAKSNNRLQRAKDYIPVQQQHQPLIQGNKGLFVRYTTDYDRKERGAAAKSNYYAIHGREESRSGTSNIGGGRDNNGGSRYGRRSRADDDEIWNRGRGIMTFSRLRRKMEGADSPSPSPSRRRSWSRDRRLGSRSRSSGSRSRSRGGSRSPEHSSRRDHASRSPESRDRMRADDYEKRGRRGDISLRLGARVQFPDEADSTASGLSTAADNRINQYASDFLAELESTFSRREKALPKTKMYSDYYEREIITENPFAATADDDDRRGGSRNRDYRDSSDRGGAGSRRRDGKGGGGGGGGGGGRDDGRRRRGDQRRQQGHDREEALKAMDARLGVPAEDRLDEYGRSRRD
ncbi:hypothetical protein BGZ99_007936, partial [Dissophora globulifera]